MLLSVLSRTLLFVVLIIGGLAAASGETAALRPMPLCISSAQKMVTPSPIPSGCSLVSLAWESRRPASTSQTQVTTIC